MELDLRGKEDNIPIVRRVDRPWGYYKLFAENIPCTAKVLHIKRNEMLSLQYHRFRDQIYYCLDDFDIWTSDRAIPIEIDGDMNFLKIFSEKHIKVNKHRRGDILYIPKLHLHRPVYRGMFKYGCIVDMAFGFNDENDIIRVKDKYGRENK
jgi:mannose-6-phosphate isomerase-like protein (cupin superfamily)